MRRVLSIFLTLVVLACANTSIHASEVPHAAGELVVYFSDTERSAFEGNLATASTLRSLLSANSLASVRPLFGPKSGEWTTTRLAHTAGSVNLRPRSR